MNAMNSRCYSQALIAFITSHILIWTILPALFYLGAHGDTLESMEWGREWQWGYDKHPPLAAWIARITVIIVGKKIEACYLLSQCCVGITFYGVWRLAKEFIAIPQALMATMLLEGVYYYVFYSPIYNPNIVMLPLWAWIAYHGWQALDKNRLIHWLALAILAGLGILAKYYTVLLLLSIMGVMVIDPKFRRNLRTSGPYCAALVFLAVITPHLIWLVHHHFTTIVYMNQSSFAIGKSEITAYHWYNHILFPLHFAFAQLASCLAAILLFMSAAYKKGWALPASLPDKQKTIFLLFVGLGPFFLTLAYSLVTGGRLKPLWGTPLWNLLGIMLFYFLQPEISSLSLRRFTKGLVAVMVLCMVVSITTMIFGLDKRIRINGALAAREVTERWQKRYNVPLPIVAGEVFLSSNIAFFAPSDPRIFIDADPEKAPWLSYDELQKQGGIMVWDAAIEGSEIPARLRKKEITAIVQPPITVPWIKPEQEKPYILGLAMVAPTKNLPAPPQGKQAWPPIQRR